MTQYKLTYFPYRGIAEPIRHVFAYSDTPFEDVRIPYEEWSDQKKEELGLEWGVLPVLDIDGERKTQTWAILRLLAKKYNLVGKNEAEEFRCEEISEAIRDYILTKEPLLESIFVNPDPVELEKRKKKFAEVDSPSHLGRFNNILEKRGSVYLVGDSLTYVDIALAHYITHYEITFGLSLAKDFPALQRHIQAVHGEPKIATWIKNRPATKF